MPEKPSIAVVDTNCFIRLLFSPLRPVLGSTLGNLTLMTLADLAQECGPGTEVAERHPWLLAPSVQQELSRNCLKFREPKATEMRNWTKTIRHRGNSLLHTHCAAKNMLIVRQLSLADAQALAAAQVLGGPLATDEWPLTWVAERVSDVDVVLTSLDLVHLMETDSKIDRHQRRQVVASWIKQGERLPADWQQRYRALFQEEVPDAQHWGP